MSPMQNPDDQRLLWLMRKRQELVASGAWPEEYDLLTKEIEELSVKQGLSSGNERE